MGKQLQLCTFHLDTFLFGVDVRQVQEVLRYQDILRVPLAPPAVRGLINLRGNVITAIDLRRQLGLPPRPDEELPTNIVVRMGEGVVSLLVDDVGDVLEVNGESFEKAPRTVSAAARHFIHGVYKLHGNILLALDIERATSIVDTTGDGDHGSRHPLSEVRSNES